MDKNQPNLGKSTSPMDPLRMGKPPFPLSRQFREFRSNKTPGLPKISLRSGLNSTPMTSGQISIIPKPELRGFWGDSLTAQMSIGRVGHYDARQPQCPSATKGDSLTKPPFKVTSADVVIICPRAFPAAHPQRTRDGPRSNQAPWPEYVSCET